VNFVDLPHCKNRKTKHSEAGKEHNSNLVNSNLLKRKEKGGKRAIKRVSGKCREPEKSFSHVYS
jgi:predicted choloylglycine hydrolase